MPQYTPRRSLRTAILLLGLLFISGCQQPDVPPATTAVSAGDVAAPDAAATAVATPTDPPTPTPAPLPELTFAIQTSTAIPASGEAIASAEGIVVQLAPEALTEGTRAELHTWEMDARWREAIAQAYTIDAPIVSLVVADLNDSQGRAILRLPAPSPESRLVAIIDNSYFAMLAVVPQDGFLETAVRLGPGNTASVTQIGSLTPGGTLQYTVMTPTAAAAARTSLGKPAQQNGRSCSLNLEIISFCRQSADGTIQVNFRPDSGLSNDEGDQLADAIATAMTRYGSELGFTAAKLTPQTPMQIVVEAGSGDPYYRSLSGIIYLPIDAARSMIGGTTYDALHEIAHWIQDEAYNMAWAYWSGNKTWWLETAAENMVMLHDPAYIPQNLITYGFITTSDNRLALQQAPYQWPSDSDFYVQAQLVKINMCDDTAVCALSQSSFITAINNGTYPYDSADAQSKVSANLDAYAKYLLGASPGQGNPDMPTGEPTSSGSSYGESIQIAQTTKADYDFLFSGIPPQMQTGTDALGNVLNVAATLQKDGVYPLTIASGFNGRNPGLPAKLTIPPGAPFWYRIGKGDPQFHDGSTELVLQPIHMTMGLPGVRLVAMGKTGGETFSATVSQIDLQGTWLVIPGEPTLDNIVCQDATVNTENGTMTVRASKEMVTQLPTFIGALGAFQPDPAGNGLTWNWVDGRLSTEAMAEARTMLRFSAAALPTVDNVQVQLGLDWPRTTSRAPTPNWPPLLLGAVILVPGIWGMRDRRKRPYAGLLTLFLATFLLVGCFGFGFNLWGTVNADMQFTQLEYIGSESIPVIGVESMPNDQPLWKLQGTADYEVDFYFAGTDDGADAATATCTGTATYNVDALIYKDIIMNLEEGQ